jgi:Flp pilus assembly protein TadG
MPGLRFRDHDKGASLVEFALLAPLLILLLFGIIEFGWLFGQYNDVKHGAREGARYAAVNAGNNAAIRTYVCNTMDGLSAGMTALRVGLNRDPDSNGLFSIGEPGRIRIEADIGSLSGLPFITTFLPNMLSSEIDFRIEQDATWTTQALTAVTC